MTSLIYKCVIYADISKPIWFYFCSILLKKNARCNPVNEFYDLPVSQGLLIEVLTLEMT